MSNDKQQYPLEQFKTHALDCMGVAATIIDPNGILLYYNQCAEKILDRKPEYIGTDIHTHHKKKESNQQVELMLKEFGAGRKDPFTYKAKPYGKTLFVTVSPIIKDDKFIGCVQTVIPE